MNRSTRYFFDHKIYVYIILIVISIGLFFKSLFYDFSPLDEQWLILGNTDELSNWKNLTSLFKKSITDLYYRPLLSVSLMLDYHFGKIHPFYYHLSNLIFHTISVLLFYKLLNLLQVENKLSFLLAMIFCVHPIVLHAVVWVPGRNDLLLSIFFISSLIFLINYLKYFSNKNLILHIIFFVGALLTKETAVLMPVLYFTLTKHYTLKNNNLFKLIILWIIPLLLWAVIRNNYVDKNPSGNYELGSSIINTISVFIISIGKALIPIQQSVYPTIKESTIIPGIISCITIILLYLKFGVKNKTIALFGLSIFLIILFIPIWVSSLRISGEHYEHRIYCSLIGILIFFSQLKFNINSKLYNLIMIIIIIAFSVKTFIRMSVYKNEDSFTNNAIIDAPDFYLFHLKKAEKMLEAKDYKTALTHFNIVIKMQPNRVKAYNGRANTFLALKRKDDAIKDCNTSINLYPSDPAAYLNRFMIYEEFGDIENAMKDFMYLKQNYPNFIPPDLEKEVTITFDNYLLNKFNKQISETPNKAILYINRAEFLLSKQMKKEALADLKKASELEPTNQDYKLYYNKLTLMLSKK